MEKLRLTQIEKDALIKSFTTTVEKAKGITDIDFSSKGYINTLNEKNIIKPTILINSDVMHKMWALVEQSKVEISWHGFVKRNIEKQFYYIYDIALFPQTNTGVSTTANEKEYAEWINNYIADPNSNFEDMRMHGHSHVNMSVYSSGVDDAYQKELIDNAEDGDYYIFLILNKKHEICALLYDFSQNVLFKNGDITIEIVSGNKRIISEWAKEVIKTYCTTPASTTHSYLGRYYKEEETGTDIYEKKRKGLFRR